MTLHRLYQQYEHQEFRWHTTFPLQHALWMTSPPFENSNSQIEMHIVQCWAALPQWGPDQQWSCMSQGCQSSFSETLFQMDEAGPWRPQEVQLQAAISDAVSFGLGCTWHKKVHVACQRPQPMLVCKGLIIMWQGHEDIVLCSKAWHLVWEALCLIFRPWICHRANVILHVQPTFFSSFFQSISFVGKEVHSKITVESLLQSLLKNS